MKKRIILLFLLILCLFLLPRFGYAADIVRYVDTGADAGGDGTTAAISSGDNTHAYQSLNQWESAEGADLDTANNTHTVHTNRTNSGGEDTTSISIMGWTTSATDFITIRGDDFPLDGVFDNTKYLLSVTNGAMLTIREDYVRIEYIQFEITQTGSGNPFGILITTSTPSSNERRISNCIIKGISSGTGGGQGIAVDSADAIVKIWNSTIYGFYILNDFAFECLILSGTVDIYNSTIYNCTEGIQQSGTVTLINTAIFNTQNDILGTVTLNYSATEDGDDSGNNGNITITQGDPWTDLVTNPAIGDFSVTDVNSELYQTGNGATPKSLFTDDIIGTIRGPADLDWDIGAFEYVPSSVRIKGGFRVKGGFKVKF